jgi:hypothetical protein
MSLKIDKDKLFSHIREDFSKKWDARIDRPKELAESFYGPGGAQTKSNVRSMQKLYAQAYFEGAQDMIKTVLAFDGDIREMEILVAFSKTLGDISE